MFRELYHIIVKNFKLIVRDFASLFLLIIGPLLIIGLLALSFSSLGFNDITIGYVNAANVDETVIQPFMSFAKLELYNDLENCKRDLKQQKLHICMLFERGEEIFETEDISDEDNEIIDKDIIKVNTYIDNTREVISIILVERIKTELGAKKEQISIQSINTVMDNMKEITIFLDKNKNDLKEIKYEINDQRDSLYEIKNELEEVRNDLIIRRNELSQLKNQLEDDLDDTKTEVNNAFFEAHQDINNAINKVVAARNFLYQMGISDAKIHNEISDVLSDLYEAKQEISDEHQKINNRLNNVNNLISQFNGIINDMDNVKKLIDKNVIRVENSINGLNNYNQKIDKAIVDITEKQGEFENMLSMDASKLVKPLLVQYTPVYTGTQRAKNVYTQYQQEIEELGTSDVQAIQILFPVVLLMLIVFISMLFSNIIVLEEVNSKAYFRNFLLPVNRTLFFVGIFVTSLIITMFQIMILLLVGHNIFLLDIFNNFLTITAIIILTAMVFTLYGMSVGYIIRTKITSVIVTIFLVIMTLLVSGILVPVERMSPFMSDVASIMVFNLSIKGLQQALFYDISLSEINGPLIGLIFHTVFMFVAVVILKYVTDRLYKK